MWVTVQALGDGDYPCGGGCGHSDSEYMYHGQGGVFSVGEGELLRVGGERGTGEGGPDSAIRNCLLH